MSSEEKEKIKKVLNNIYEIDNDFTNHCIQKRGETYEIVVDDEEYSKSAEEALYDIMAEIEKIVDIIK